MHRFLDNDVHLQTGNDVMVIFSLGGVVHNFQWWILKEWPQVYNHALLTYFANIQPPTSYSTFSFWLGFRYCRRNLRGFGEKWPQKVKVSKNTWLESTSYVRKRLLSYCAWKSVHGYGLYAWLGNKQKTKNITTRHATRIFHHHVGAPTLIRSWQNLTVLLIRKTLSPLQNFISNNS